MNGVMQQLLSLTFSSLLNQVAYMRNNICMLEQDSPSHHFSYQKVHIWKTLAGQTPVQGTMLSLIIIQVILCICYCHVLSLMMSGWALYAAEVVRLA